MEGLTIPMLSIFSPMVAWLVWLTIKTLANDKSIAVNTSNDERVGEQIRDLKTDLNNRIDKMETHMESKFDRVLELITKK